MWIMPHPTQSLFISPKRCEKWSREAPGSSQEAEGHLDSAAIQPHMTDEYLGSPSSGLWGQSQAGGEMG
jgi:hypothetical protein